MTDESEMKGRVHLEPWGLGESSTHTNEIYEFEIEVWALSGDGEGPPSPLKRYREYGSISECMDGTARIL